MRKGLVEWYVNMFSNSGINDWGTAVKGNVLRIDLTQSEYTCEYSFDSDVFFHTNKKVWKLQSCVDLNFEKFEKILKSKFKSFSEIKLDRSHTSYLSSVCRLDEGLLRISTDNFSLEAEFIPENYKITSITLSLKDTREILSLKPGTEPWMEEILEQI